MFFNTYFSGKKERERETKKRTIDIGCVSFKWNFSPG